MDTITLLLLLSMVMALLTQSATAAAIHNRRHDRTRGHVARLQETVDRLLLRQRTDHILMTNLQKAVEKLLSDGREKDPQTREESSPSESSSDLSMSVSAVEAEGRALAALGEKVAEVRTTLSEALKVEDRADDMTQLRQELAYLRSEVQHLKSVQATESGRSSAHNLAKEQRDAVTAAWVVDNVNRLQDALLDIQQSCNVTQAMHDKQEVESRLLVVTKDLSALRGSMAAVTSKAEAAAATSQVLEEELRRTSEDAHRSASHLASLSTEVTSLREDFNDLLSALPEGTMVGPAPSSSSSSPSSISVDDDHHTQETNLAPASTKISSGGGVSKVAQAWQARQTERVRKLEQRADDIDFALTRLQKQVSSSSSSGKSVEAERLAQVSEAERQLETRVEAASSGVGEVKSSSVQLLAALDALQARLEREVTEVKQEVAKLEFTVAQSTAERKTREEDVRVAHDETAALRSDLQVISRRLDSLFLKTATMEGRELGEEVSGTQCRTQHLSLELKLEDTLNRIAAVEDQLRHFKHRRTGTHHGHRHFEEDFEKLLETVSTRHELSSHSD